MKQFFLTMLGVFAGLVTFFVILPIVGIFFIIIAASSSKPTTPTQTVLELDLRQGLTDQPTLSPFASLGGSGLSVMQVVDTLAQAEKDSSVKVLLIRAAEGGMTPAAADELRQAIKRFRATGKTVIAHSQGFMPSGSVMSSYMVASSADQLWLQSTAGFQATGLSSDAVFLGRAFEKYGVKAEFEQRYEYKNAVNEMTERDFTPAHREAQLAWMTSIYTSALGQIAVDRKLEPQALRTTIEAGPYSAEQALQLKLVDKIGEVEEAEKAAKDLAGKDAKIVDLASYSSLKGHRNGSGKSAIAIVNAEGAIVTGRGGSDSLFGGSNMIRSDDTAKALYKAIEDKAVKAIVLRVSSPGGSPEASEQILTAVRAAKAAGKPVVVSMGAYAASGGYWISSESDWIVAQPTTLTGSIGVYGGKLVLSEALGRFGLDMREIAVGGDYANAFSPTSSFSAQDRAAFSASMDRIYDGFITRVARGRDLPQERVREIAKGRVWTGAQAKELGLVDQLGGLEEAILKARQLAKIPSSESVRYKRYPSPQSPWEAIASAFGTSSQTAKALVSLGQVINDPTAQNALKRIETERMRQTGAVVLADQPTF